MGACLPAWLTVASCGLLSLRVLHRVRNQRIWDILQSRIQFAAPRGLLDGRPCAWLRAQWSDGPFGAGFLLETHTESGASQDSRWRTGFIRCSHQVRTPSCICHAGCSSVLRGSPLHPMYEGPERIGWSDASLHASCQQTTGFKFALRADRRAPLLAKPPPAGRVGSRFRVSRPSWPYIGRACGRPEAPFGGPTGVAGPVLLRFSTDCDLWARNDIRQLPPAVRKGAKTLQPRLRWTRRRKSRNGTGPIMLGAKDDEVDKQILHFRHPVVGFGHAWFGLQPGSHAHQPFCRCHIGPGRFNLATDRNSHVFERDAHARRSGRGDWILAAKYRGDSLRKRRSAGF